MPNTHSLPSGTIAQNHQVLNEVLEIIRRFYIDHAAASKLIPIANLNYHEDEHVAIRRVLKALEDPYTRFLEPGEVSKLSKFDVSGVGLLLSGDGSGDLYVAAKPEVDTAAGRAGIERGDRVVRIDGMNLKGKSAFEAAEVMQGDEGGVMEVVVDKNGKLGIFELVRNYKVKDPVSYRMVEVGGGDGERELKVGYVRLKEFNASCRLGVQHALEDLETNHPDGYVLDLKSNPGGVFEGAVEIAGLFLGNSSLVAHVTGAGGKVQDFVSRTVGHVGDYKTIPQSTPLVVLLNSSSASSSEVLAGALRDNCRAVVVGETSYGKGLIQGVFSVSDGSGLVATVAKYQTPNGGEIQGNGIAPDFERTEGVVEQLKGLLRGRREIPQLDWDDVRHRLEMCKAN